MKFMSTNQLNSAAKTIFKAFSTSALVFSVLFFNFPLSANAVTQDISYTINDNGGPVVGYYNVKDNGNKVFNWNVDVNFNGPGGMHVVTIGAYDEQAGSAATTKHPFGVSSSGKVDYRNAPESGSFSFSYDTARDSRLGQCGRVQIDGSFINETSPTYDDSNLFFAMVIDYGVDCVAPPANTAPVITLLGSNPVNMTVGGTYVDAGATAHDQEDGNITANIHTTGTVNTSVAGTYTITYNVSDSAGLAATPVTRTVNVNPAPVNHPPVITLVGSTPVNITVGSLYVDQGATALDQEDGNITANIQKTGTVNTAVVGSYTITYNVSDSKGLAAVPVTRTVNVVPAPVNNRPVITLVGSSTINIIAGALYVDQGATATDVEDGNITANIQKTGVVNTSVVGTYTVTYNVSDSQGLAAIPVTRTVIVIPANQRPVITLIGLNPISVTIGSAYTDPGATAQDFEDGDITAHIVATSTVNTAVLGAYTVTYNVSDSDGLAAIPVTRTVNVVPLAPTVTLNANPINVPYGQSTTLTWVSTDATSCIATGDWSGSKTLSGNEVISNLILNETFIITCTGISGSASSTASVIVGPQISDISVLKVADKTTLNVGDTVTYTITVSNAGPNNATGVTATDLLSDKLNFVSASTTSGSYATSTGVWTIGHLNNSTSTVLTLVATVKSGNEGAIINNSVTSSSDQQDPNSGNNTSGVDVTVNHAANHPPVITIIGANPATVTVGQSYLDPGATAQDHEDGDITAHIVATSTVNTAVVGTYTVTYNVSDSDGLAAVPVSRTVNVLEDTTVTPKGQITFCLVLANDQNTIATTSAGLPAGIFDINLSTSTDINSNVLTSKTWNTSAFAPNTKLILQENDADCVTHSNLELGTYYYSSTTNNGSRWNVAKYNDKYNQTINNVFDFFSYSPELFTATTTDDSLRNMNADGQIVLTAQNNNQSINLYSTYNPAPQCLLPEITSSLTASVVENNPFTYTFTASSTITNLSIATTSLPAGLSFSTTTNSITGTPTQTGTFNINLTAANNCGTTTAILVLTVSTSGGGGGGGSTSSNLSVTKVADKSSIGVGETLTYTVTVINNGPDNATGVNLTEVFPSKLTLVSATSTLGTYSTTTSIWTIGNLLNGSSTTLTLIGTVNAGTEGQTITNSVSVTATQSDPNGSNNSTTVSTTVNPAVVPPCTNCGGGGGGGGGGNGPIVGSYGGTNGPVIPQVAGATEVKACYYLYDYLRKDFINNPVEVTKLQVFLRDLEGFKDIQVTGVYDDQTIIALNAFQWRYRDDVLTPWGHTAPTSYTYILTKKKVNEIYCKTAFPVNAQQQEEIDNYRNFLLSLRNAGITIPENVSNPSSGTTTAPVPAIDGAVGSIKPATSTVSAGLTTLAGVSSTTQRIAGSLTATVFLAGKRVVNAIVSMFKWPFESIVNPVNQCVRGLAIFGWINILLLAIIIIISYFWYKEYKNNRIIEDVNKEIDLN